MKHSKLYTKNGDKGITQLCDKRQLSKNDARIWAIGTVDELNSLISIVYNSLKNNTVIKSVLSLIQQDLSTLNAELADSQKNIINARYITHLEKIIDELDSQLPPITGFITADSLASSYCHFARATCRRVERYLVALNEQEKINPQILCYINRLGDLLFVIARSV